MVVMLVAGLCVQQPVVQSQLRTKYPGLIPPVGVHLEGSLQKEVVGLSVQKPRIHTYLATYNKPWVNSIIFWKALGGFLARSGTRFGFTVG